jgi:hypothetical protein
VLTFPHQNLISISCLFHLGYISSPSYFPYPVRQGKHCFTTSLYQCVCVFLIIFGPIGWLVWKCLWNLRQLKRLTWFIL